MTSFAQTLSISQQLVTPRSQRSRARAADCLHLLAPTVLFIALLAQLWLRVEIVELGYKQQSLRSEALRKDAQLRQLRLDLAYASRPANLAPTVERKLGLQRLAPAAVRNSVLSTAGAKQ